MYLGAWRRGPVGLEADAWQGGVKQETYRICRTAEIPMLLKFLAEEFPDEVSQWLRVRQSALNLNKEPLAVLEKSWEFPSQSGGDNHIVTYRGGRWSCSCPAYGWGKTCWATKEAQRILEAENAKGQTGP
jgi:hypothetical protein